MAAKTKILVFGDSPVVLRALEQYVRVVPDMTEYEFLDFCDYNGPVSADLYGAADIVMFSLYRRYGIRLRAEGIPALESRLSKGKKGLLYDFSNCQLVHHPLVWVIPGAIPLADKLRGLIHADGFSGELPALRQIFQKDIFPIDGHRQ